MRIITLRNLQLSIFLTICFFVLFILSSCDDGANSSRGFTLPQGDAEKGTIVFINSQCIACHTITGFDDPSIKKELAEPVALGGKVTRIKTYADLVTSVINPSHRIAKAYQSTHYQSNGVSKMKNYNDTMTITELTDLVTFLQPHYTLVEFHHTRYGMYP